MKRLIGSLVFAAVVGIAVAQPGPFTIIRPADGSKIREKVKLMFPKGSIPDSGYVGIFINGQFIEATVPPAGAKYIEYTLDTKKLALPDGPATIEARLYVDFNEKPRVVDTSSVQVTVANQANITVPEDGFALRYKFLPGSEMVYKLSNEVKFASIAESQAQKGGRALERSIEAESARVLYAIDNKYPDGDGLLRMQLLPDKGKDYVLLSTPQNPQGRRMYDNEMQSIYMRVGPTGMERFSSVPQYVAFEGGLGQARTDVMIFYPLPTLPVKKVKPGDVWQTRFLMSSWDTSNLYNVEKLTETVPARGEFLNVEWEMGHPCAKIRHSLEVGDKKNVKGQIGKNTLAMEEIIYFALDLGQVVRMDRSQVLDVKAAPTAPTAGANTGRGGRTPAAGAAGAGGNKGGGGAGASDFGETLMLPPTKANDGTALRQKATRSS